MKKKLSSIYKRDGQDKVLPRLSLAIYNHARLAAILWICLTVFGVTAYTSLMKREGFPSISVPFTLVSGTYLVNDAAKVDREVARPISELILQDSRVKTVQANSRGMFYTIVTQYETGTDAVQAGRDLEKRIRDEGRIPAQAAVKVEAPEFGVTERGDDAVVTVYTEDDGLQPPLLVAEAGKLTERIRDEGGPDLSSISVIDPYVTSTDPRNGKQVTTQTKFDRYGERKDGQTKFYQSVAVGIRQTGGTDVIKLDDRLQDIVREFNDEQGTSGIRAAVSASYAPSIKEQIGELQRALLEGLIAVLVVGSLVIAIRASLITVLSMVTVLAITAAVIFLFGYTLNTITLFALILCLGLIVDDTIIMVEAIDAQRRRLNDPRDIVKTATRKVSRAMVAATLTASLSFAPLIFASGVLGSFIRAIPITVITSLLISLIVALVFIPLFARYLLLGRKQVGAANVREPAAKVEARIANFISRPMLRARHSRPRLFVTGLAAVFAGLAFVGAGAFLFQKVTFNIFPPSKDANGLTLDLRFAPGTSLKQAEQTAGQAQEVVADVLGENLRSASYFANASETRANMRIDIIPYDEREVRAPELESRLKEAFRGFQGAKVEVGVLDVGPPPSAFNVRIVTDDRAKGLALANDVSAFLERVELERPSGELARVAEVTAADPGSYSRAGRESYIPVSATFDASDTTTLVGLAQDAVLKEFNAERLSGYGLTTGAIGFDLGQEQDNQDAFKSLAFAFPVLLVVIYLLLALQFRSLLQPLLIFMAIPFSLFGITLGLYLTDNAFSFFAMLGFFALIGLSIKNTILLTDYANQLRREGAGAVDAAVGALAERFRPLIATSLTAVVSLLPLAILSPFWEGLAVVLIGGLLSSTFLVVTVFPYYYLGAEYLRMLVRRRPR